MIDSRRWHPVLRYSTVLVGGTAALVLAYCSWWINPHSVAWLVGIYTTAGLFMAALRAGRKSVLHRSYALYLFMLTQYLICVWLLHVSVPSGHPEIAKQHAAHWAWFFYPGLIFNAQAHFHFALRFAEIRSKLMRALEIVCWGVSIYFFVLNCFDTFVLDYIWAGYTWVPTLEGGYKSFFPFTTFLLTLGVLVPFVKLFTCRDRKRRLQLAYYLMGAAPVWICCWGNFLISWGVNIYPAGGVMFLLHVAIIGYAVFRHQLFDFTIVIRRGLAYAAVSLVLGLTYGSLIWVGALSHLSGTTEVLFPVALIFLVGLVYAPLLSYVQSRIDRFFFRETAQRQRLLEQFARDTASTVKLGRVAEFLSKVLSESFSPRFVSLYLKNESGKAVLFGQYLETFTLATWPTGEGLPERLVESLRNSAVPYAATPSIRSEKAGFTLSEGDDGLIVPILHGQVLLGCILLGPRKADAPYEVEDIRLAETIAAHSSTALQNARSFSDLEQLQHLTQRTLEELTAGVLVIHRSGRILQANRMAQLFFETGNRSFPNTLEDFWAQHPIIGAEIRHAVHANHWITNQEIQVAGNTTRFFLLNVCPLDLESADPLFLVLVYEITQYKELEATARNREALARVGEAISSINHEIKNVIQPIRYQIDQLATLETDDRLLKRIMKIVPDRLSALEKLLANLRDLSRPIELRKRRIDLADMVESIWLDLKTLTMATGVDFELLIPEDQRFCFADGHWLRQVLYNLIKNSVEATSGVSAPRIVVRSQIVNTHFYIQVEDNGCGVEEHARVQLFAPFFSTKGESGTGLGLSISQRIIELHGGKISIEGIGGTGAIFQVSLPCHEGSSTDSSSIARRDK